MPSFVCKYCGVILDVSEITPDSQANETDRIVADRIERVKAKRLLNPKKLSPADLALLDNAPFLGVLSGFHYSIDCPICQRSTFFTRKEPLPIEQPTDGAKQDASQ